MADRLNDLRQFLRGARARITPERAGLGAGRRRRVPGLRREEVAELAGISDVWYARFESGRAVVSLSALDRVADALRLSRDERIRLMVLARPDVRDMTAAQLGDAFNGMASAVAGLRDYARECSAASSFEELTRYAVRAVHVTCGAKSTGYCQKFLATSDEIPFVALCGNGGEVLEGHRQKSDTIPHVMPAILDGLAVSESDLRRSPSAELRGRVAAGFYAYYSQPVMGQNGLHSWIGAAFVEPHVAEPTQIRVLEAVAAISELTLRSSTFPEHNRSRL